jgi:membrane protein
MQNRIIKTRIDYVPTNSWQKIIFFIDELFKEFSEDNCWNMSAMIAYYTAFSLAPTLVIVIAIADIFLEKQAVSGEIYGQIRNIVGDNAAEVIQNLIKNASLATDTTLGTIISSLTALLGATTVFVSLHTSLNSIWQVYHLQEQGILVLLRQRLAAFLMLLAIGFLLIALIVLNTVSDFVYAHFIEIFAVPPSLFLRLAHSVVSFLSIMVLFALVFKILSDVKFRWRDLWAGAALTSGLFILGRWGISFYLTKSNISSVYGAAGSLAILLTWIYYSTIILFLGAEFIKIYIRYQGGSIAHKKKSFKVFIAPPKS